MYPIPDAGLKGLENNQGIHLSASIDLGDMLPSGISVPLAGMSKAHFFNCFLCMVRTFSHHITIRSNLNRNYGSYLIIYAKMLHINAKEFQTKKSPANAHLQDIEQPVNLERTGGYVTSEVP